jgi:hypothetical protein
MHGPPLTPQEAVASVARRVRRLEAHGLDRNQAIRCVAVETGIDAEKVRWCAVDRAQLDRPVRHLRKRVPKCVPDSSERSRAPLGAMA